MRKVVTAFFLALLCAGAYAQTRTVKGFVLEEETGQPLPAATISIDGSGRGVIAGLDGDSKKGALFCEARRKKVYIKCQRTHIVSLLDEFLVLFGTRRL